MPRYRLIGINFETLYSLWGEELIDDKKLKLSIKQRAIDLLAQLQQAHIGLDRPVVWVCHSMGGLIVKQMMVDSPQLMANTKSIVFMSTPHLGSGAAKATALFSFATKPSTEIYELVTNSKYLIELNQRFLVELRRHLESHNASMHIVSLLEKQPIYLGFNLYWSETVHESSANIGIGEFHRIENRDHINICKPENRNSEVYRHVRDAINRVIENECLTCERCKREVEDAKTRRWSEIFYEFFKPNCFY